MATVVGTDIGGTKARLCVHGDGPEHVEDFPTGAALDGATLAAALTRRLDAAGARAAAIGLAVPGLVDDGRVVVSDVLPRLAGWRPAEALASLGAHLVVLNDAKAGLVEAASLAPPDDTIALVMVGTGIGAALRAHGRDLAGASGRAGELGSIPIELDGRVVPLDDAAAGAAILRALASDASGVHARLAAGDADARAVVQRAGDALGRGLATLVNLLNPGTLVLAGGTLRFDGYLPAAREALDRWALAPLRAACTVIVPPDGALLPCRGAARAARAALELPASRAT